jgi:hypothetical protein
LYYGFVEVKKGLQNFQPTLRLAATTKSEAAALADCPRIKYRKLDAVKRGAYLQR